MKVRPVGNTVLVKLQTPYDPSKGNPIIATILNVGTTDKRSLGIGVNQRVILSTNNIIKIDKKQLAVGLVDQSAILAIVEIDEDDDIY